MTSLYASFKRVLRSRRVPDRPLVQRRPAPDWLDAAINDANLRAAGVIEDDQPSPWSHWSWQQGALARRDLRRRLDDAIDPLSSIDTSDQGQVTP